MTEVRSNADADADADADVAVADRGTKDADGDVADAPTRRRWFRILLSVIGIAATGMLIVGAVTAGSTWLADRSRDAHRQALVDAASAGVLALIDVHTDTADADLARVEALSAGQFAEELSNGQSGLAAAIRDSAVDSDGRIDSAALASEDQRVVLVAASAQVTNRDSPNAVPRTYRLRVTLDEDDGVLLMSRVEFVP